MSKSDELKVLLLDSFRFLAPGTRIPSRNFIRNKYNVSRGTVDKVIDELISDNILYGIKGSGTFISSDSSLDLKNEIINWGVVVPNIMEDICPVFLRGIEDFAQKHSINTIICNTDNDPNKESEYLIRLINTQASGIIIIPTIIPGNNIKTYERVINSNIPFVFCCRFLQGLEHIPFVASNDFYGSYLATKHLLEMGYLNIGFISRYQYQTSIERYCGYTAALLEAGIEPNPDQVILKLNNVEKDLNKFFVASRALKNPPDAFLCHNDRIAMSLFNTLSSCGIKVSDNIGIIGYDNTSLCDLLNPKLTSVDFKNYEMGLKAAEILYKTSNDGTSDFIKTNVLQPSLVIRESCLGKKYLAVERQYK